MLSSHKSLYVDTDDIHLLSFCPTGGIHVITSAEPLGHINPLFNNVENFFCITASDSDYLLADHDPFAPAISSGSYRRHGGMEMV